MPRLQAFERAPGGELAGAVLLHLGMNATELDLSPLVGAAPSAAGWTFRVQAQRGGAPALLGNMSTVAETAVPVPAGGVVTVPAYAVAVLEGRA